MALAETARLIASLELKDKLSPGVASATKGLNTLQTRFSGVTGGLTKLGSGLSNTAGRIKNLLSGPLGMLGMGAGLLGLEQFISRSLTTARDFGEVVDHMSAATGLSVETTSALASAFARYEIDGERALKITTFLEKSVGNLTKTGKTAAKFEADFGFRIRDSSGHVKDANQLILDAADYFNNKHIPAQKKAAAMAKLFGRSWADLLPILQAGSKGLKDAEEEARALGLTITKDNLKQLEQAREASRSWGVALGGLQLQIGIGLMPYLTDLAKWATSFVRDDRDKIVKFFKDGADFAAGMGNAIATTVVPAIRGIIDVWNKIPADFQKLLIGGFVVNKLTGGALTDLVGALGKGLIKGVLGMTAGVVDAKAGVVNVSGPVVGGGVGGPAGTAAGGIPKTFLIGTALSAAVLAGILVWVEDNVVMPELNAAADANLRALNKFLNTGTLPELKTALDGLQKMPDQLNPLQKVLYDLNANGVKTHTEALEAAIRAEILSRQLAGKTAEETLANIAAAWKTGAQDILTGLRVLGLIPKAAKPSPKPTYVTQGYESVLAGIRERARAKYGQAPSEANVLATYERWHAAKAARAALVTGKPVQLGPMKGGGGVISTKDADTKTAVTATGKATATELAIVQEKLRNVSTVTAAGLAAVGAIVGRLASTTSTGLSATAAAGRGAADAIRAKDMSPRVAVTVPVYVTSTVSVRGLNVAQSVHASYNPRTRRAGAGGPL